MKSLNSSIINKVIPVIILLMGLFSCDRDKVFEMEQYKNVFALISGTDNVYEKFFDLRDSISIGYLSASCGGTNPTQKDIFATIVEDCTLIDDYNRINFDVEYEEYALALPKSNYIIDSYQLKIPEGVTKGTLSLQIRAEGLSPDSVYFIPLKVDSHDSYEVNPEKNFVLYQVRIKNFYAKGDGTTTYNLMGHEGERGIFGTKIMHPLSANKVRMIAGAESYKNELEVFDKYAIVLEVDEDNRVYISPYGRIQINQVDNDPDYPNIFKVETDGYKHYKTFLLRYDYTSGTKTYQMKEELRFEFNPKNEDEL